MMGSNGKYCTNKPSPDGGRPGSLLMVLGDGPAHASS